MEGLSSSITQPNSRRRCHCTGSYGCTGSGGEAGENYRRFVSANFPGRERLTVKPRNYRSFRKKKYLRVVRLIFDQPTKNASTSRLNCFPPAGCRILGYRMSQELGIPVAVSR